jgi:hypothetical protein
MSGMTGKNWYIPANGNSNNNNRNGKRRIDPSTFNEVVAPVNNNNKPNLSNYANLSKWIANYERSQQPYVPPSASGNLQVNNNNNEPYDFPPPSGNLPYNFYNNNNNNFYNERLDTLMLTAHLIIAQYDQTGHVDYFNLSNILHDILVYPGLQAPEGSDELRVINRLKEIQSALAPAALFPPPVNIYTNLQHRGVIPVPKNTSNALSLGSSTIVNGNTMINFQGEKDFGRYYKKKNFNKFEFKDGFKKNPYTRVNIDPTAPNTYTYIANVPANLNQNLREINTSLFETGGKRKKTRRSKMSKKTRKHKK